MRLLQAASFQVSRALGFQTSVSRALPYAAIQLTGSRRVLPLGVSRFCRSMCAGQSEPRRVQPATNGCLRRGPLPVAPGLSGNYSKVLNCLNRWLEGFGPNGSGDILGLKITRPSLIMENNRACPKCRTQFPFISRVGDVRYLL